MVACVTEKRTETRDGLSMLGGLCHTKRTVRIFQGNCHKCVSRIPIIEDSRDRR